MFWIIDWLLKIEGFINKCIDFLLKKDEAPKKETTNIQGNKNGQNIIINVENLTQYFVDPKEIKSLQVRDTTSSVMSAPVYNIDDKNKNI